MHLYAATSNPGKLAEFTQAAIPYGITIEPLPNLKDLPEPEETATTFRGNAELKAIAYSLHAPNLLVMADDSGLEVEALGNRPGVRSARFADDMGWQESGSGLIGQESGCPGSGFSDPGVSPPISTLTKDDRNNRCLLSLLAALPNPTRAARFVCDLAVARNGKVLHHADGHIEGILLRAPRGEDGFGYDPLFLVPSLNQTLAEIPRNQKWDISHRGNAFRNLLQQLHP